MCHRTMELSTHAAFMEGKKIAIASVTSHHCDIYYVFQVCPALAMGNTVVLKPATYTRLSALLFAEICAEAGLPPGTYMS